MERRPQVVDCLRDDRAVKGDIAYRNDIPGKDRGIHMRQRHDPRVDRPIAKSLRGEGELDHMPCNIEIAVGLTPIS